MAKKSTKTKTTPKRYVPRQTRKFQLRHNHPIDAHVGEILDFSRSQRREVTVIRDGVRLLWALENNDLSVLFELFPHLKSQFVPDGLSLMEQIQTLFLNSQVLRNEPQPELKASSGAKALKAPTFDLPTFDDDDELPTLITNKNTNIDLTANLLQGIASLQ
jgi:hypothetical protein